MYCRAKPSALKGLNGSPMYSAAGLGLVGCCGAERMDAAAATCSSSPERANFTAEPSPPHNTLVMSERSGISGFDRAQSYYSLA